jgi:membrane fusion protein (multidrug efflux system)
MTLTIDRARPLTALAFIFVAGLLVAGCDAPTPPPTVEFRIPVEVVEIETGSVEDIIVTTGTLRTRESVILNVETPGYLAVGRDAAGNRLSEGSVVAVGQLIAESIGEDARLAARINATREHLQAMKQELDRRTQLLARKLIAEEELSRARANYETALHDYDTSKRTTEKAKIHTPITGVILQLARDEDGMPVADGQKVNPGFEVARIAPIDRLIADVDLVGPELARVSVGQNTRIRHYAFEKVPMPGRILRLAPSMDPRTHSFRAEVDVDNARRLLKPGMFVEVSIVAERRTDVPVVPREAVTQRAGRNVVFVVEGQRVARRDVSLGLVDDDRIEVIDGLTPGDRVVIRGLETLTDGTKVRVISS